MIVVSQVLDFLGPRPGLAIVRVHQGKVEVALRIALIALVFFTFICAAFLLTHLRPDDILEGDKGADVLDEFADTRPTCQWIIFVCWMAIAVQGLSLALRFLNLELVEKYIGFVLIGGIVLHALFILSWFAGAISFAVRSARWLRLLKKYREESDRTVIDRIPFTAINSSVAASSSFCFLTLLAEIMLTIWVVMWLVLRWQQLVTQQLRYKPGLSSGKDDEEED